jgi:hypothetical protein
MLFMSVDVDGSGSIDMDEFYPVFHEVCVRECLKSRVGPVCINLCVRSDSRSIFVHTLCTNRCVRSEVCVCAYA